MAYQRVTDRWLQAIEPWLVGAISAEGEHLALPGMPEPPAHQLARALPFQLAFYADKDGANVRPTYDRLARLNGCSVDTVRRGMRHLERLGLIVRQGPAYRGHAQVYVLAFPTWLAKRKGVTGDPLSTGKGGTGATHSEEKGWHTEPERVARVLPHQSPTGIGPTSSHRKVHDEEANYAPPEQRTEPEPERVAPLPVPASCEYIDDGSGLKCMQCGWPEVRALHHRAKSIDEAMPRCAARGCTGKPRDPVGDEHPGLLRCDKCDAYWRRRRESRPAGATVTALAVVPTRQERYA